jgi:hypothetical protein
MHRAAEVGALLSKSTNVVYNGHSSNNTEIRGYSWTMLPLNNIDIASAAASPLPMRTRAPTTPLSATTSLTT